MSKAGAVAVREAMRIEEALAEANSILEAARIIYEQEEAQRVERARSAMLRLLKASGIPAADPFVLDDFLIFEPHQRVCVDIDGLLIVYGKTDGGALYAIAGRCGECGNMPFRLRVKTMSDLGKANSETARRCAERYRCEDCNPQRYAA